MDKTRIDWCQSTFNPITGCLHGCQYCYARDIANRFKGYDYHDGEPNVLASTAIELTEPVTITRKNGKQYAAPYPFGFKPTFHRYKLNEYANKPGRNIFVCSMADLFGEWVPDEWIEDVFEACKAAPQHNYLFLTKNPARYIELENDRKLPWSDNFWFGTSVTKQSDNYTWFKDKKFHWFLSIEPLLEDLKNMDVQNPLPEWIIIGAETGRRKDRVIPKREWIENIVDQCRVYGIPVFMKQSLTDIWGEELIHEFPEPLRDAGRTTI